MVSVLPITCPPAEFVIFWCGPQSAISALTPKPLWGAYQNARIELGMKPLAGDKRFYWGAAPSDWSGGELP